jgi:predicted O-linked N-acetylglucosamine transferase (SPINDLY family)
LTISPQDPGAGAAAKSLLAAALHARDGGDRALAGVLFERALAASPDDADVVYSFGLFLADSGHPDRACRLLNDAFARQPGNLMLASGLGVALRASGRFALAESIWRSIAEVLPGRPQPFYELGQSLMGQARPEDAVEPFRTALALAEGSVQRDLLWKAYLLAMAYADGIDPRLVRDENRRHAAELAPAEAPAAHDNDPDPERRLRVGYVSSDFRMHSVARTMEALFAHRDRARYEIFAYAQDNAKDEVTQKFRAMADGWVSTVGLDDASVASRIRADRIDVLVMSAAHFDDNRLGIALHRPAPVQVSIYDSAPTGSDAFDALVVDPAMAGGGDDFPTERLLRLPRMYCHPAMKLAPPVMAPPIRANGYPTFGSANHPSKFSKRTFALWAAALRAVPAARLRLKSGTRYDESSMRETIERRFAELGIAAERIVFDRGDLGLAAHLEFYGRIDVSLDTTPFNGATTTFESLWMGVPVVALRGRTIMSRWASAVLARIGRAGWAADDEAGFARIAAELAAGAAGQDREALRARVAGSSLCDPAGHARDYERVYRALWRRWCRRRT